MKWANSELNNAHFLLVKGLEVIPQVILMKLYKWWKKSSFSKARMPPLSGSERPQTSKKVFNGINYRYKKYKTFFGLLSR